MEDSRTANQIAIAVSETGATSQRRIALLVDPCPTAFLTDAPGLNSGPMIADISSAALASGSKALSNPRSVDGTPTSANQEDHVAMSCHAARRLLEMNRNLARIVAIEEGLKDAFAFPGFVPACIRPLIRSGVGPRPAAVRRSGDGMRSR